MESLLPLLNCEVAKQPYAVPIYEIAGLTEQDMFSTDKAFAEWQFSIEVHIGSLILDPKTFAPAMSPYLYEEVAEYVEANFQHIHIAQRGILWYILINGLVTYASILLNKRMFDTYFTKPESSKDDTTTNLN